MSKAALLVSGRRSKFVVLGAWLLVVTGLGPLAGKFESAQNNEPSGFFPGGAESVKVLRASGGFGSGVATPAIVVDSAPGGFDGAKRAAVLSATPPPRTGRRGRASPSR